MAKKKDIPVFTHKQLVGVAYRYLMNQFGCHVVLAELASSSPGEIPDAIGWQYGSASTLIECKVSRSDFLADKHKPFRVQVEQGVGLFRYYMAPKGLLVPEEMPDGWGLLQVDGASRVYVSRKGKHFLQRNYRQEMRMMVGALRRVQLRLDHPLTEFIGPVTVDWKTSQQNMIRKEPEMTEKFDYV